MMEIGPDMKIEYNNFFYYSNYLQKAVLLSDVYAKLYTLESGNSQFMFTRALLHKHKMLISTLDMEKKYDNPVISTSIRQNGNALFKEKLYSEAVKKYSECLKNCNPNTECSALAQANLSAAYFHMGQLEYCLKHAHHALASKYYPSKLAYKLHDRIGRVERVLGFTEFAKKSFALCLKRLDEADMSAENKLKFRVDVEMLLTKCEEQPIMPKWTTEKPLVEQHLVGGKNENIPALSAFVELKMSENMGRGVYATRDINPGDVVAIDEPYISGPFTDHKEVCHYNGCMKIESAQIQCPKCLLVSYCNKDCMNKDDDHHLECPIMHFIRSTPGITKINQLAVKWFLRAYSKMGLQKYCSIVDNFSKSKIDPITRGFNEIGQYKSDNFMTAYSLGVGENKMSIDILFFFNCIAVELIHALGLSGLKISESYIGTVGASLVRILIILDWNYRTLNLGAQSFRRNDHLLSFTIALALYPTISLFNHSCDANISQSGNILDRTRVMKAIQPIPKGTQEVHMSADLNHRSTCHLMFKISQKYLVFLFCTYGVMFIELNKKERKNFCINRFQFKKCYCEPCIKDWPTYNYIPNRLSTLNILNISMTETVFFECNKFMEFSKSVEPKDYCRHLNYLYSFIKLLYANVRRPFMLYEDCVEMILTGHYVFTELPF